MHDHVTFPREDIAQHIELVLIGPGLIYGLVHKLDCIRKRFTIDVDKLIFITRSTRQRAQSSGATLLRR